MEGYKSNKPDFGWWDAQIEAGKRWKEDVANTNKWDTWRKYYRNEWDERIFPKNIFFSMRRTIVPRVYFRNPSISISAGTFGAEAIAKARVLERIDNQQIRRMGLKREMQTMVDTAFITGVAIGKLGYGSRYAPTPEVAGTQQHVGKNGERVEYGKNIRDNQPWFKEVRPENFIVEKGARNLDDSFFTAELHKRPWDELVRDPRFPQISSSTPPPKVDPLSIEGFDDDRPRVTVDMWEIRDRRNRSVFMYAPNLQEKHKLLMPVMEDEFQAQGSINYFTFCFNPDDECFWSVSDACLLEPIQLELNELKTKMMYHRRLNIIKLIAEKGAIDQIEAQKMLDENVGAFVTVNEIDKIQQIKVLGIPPEMIQQEQMLMQDARELIGFSRNAFGDFASGSADRTATEVQAVKQAAEIRVDERRDKLADLLVDIVNGMNFIIFNHWNTEQVIDVVGENRAKVWVKFKGKDLATGNLSVEVDPDSSVPQTKALREQKAIQTYQLLGGNPDVNQRELLKILVKELGVSYMQLLPETAEGTDPISVQQFGNQLSALQGGMAPQGGSTQPQGGQNPQSTANQVFQGEGGLRSA